MPGGPELSDKVPDAIFQLVESFKKFVREQKAHRDQKLDVDPILQVDKETDDFMLAFQRVSVDCDTNKQLIEQIKNDTTKLLRQAELAYSLLRPYLANTMNLQQQNQLQQQQQQQQQHQQNQFGAFGTSTLNNTSLNTQSNGTFLPRNLAQQHEQPSVLSSGMRGFQLNNGLDSAHNQAAGRNHFASTTSSQYFAELADQFETRMRAYGEQIKDLKMSLDSIVKTHNADELFKWLKKQHEILGEIAAKVYMTHDRIMDKKSELEKASMSQVLGNGGGGGGGGGAAGAFGV